MIWDEDQVIDPKEVGEFLKEHKEEVGYVAFIHHETTSGAINSLESITNAIRSEIPDAVIMVDAMSSFGAYDVNLNECSVDYLISSFNKCI